MNTNNMIIEIGAYQVNKYGNVVCGDTLLSRRIDGDNRFVAVLSDGLGSGIKANVLSTMTASMALNFRLRREPVIESAISIMNTLPLDTARNISYSTFTIVDVDFEGDTTVVEYGNPSLMIERDGKVVFPKKEKLKVIQSGKTKYISVSKLKLYENDRMFMVSDGVTQAGIGKAETPFGWGSDGLADFIQTKILENKQISANDFAREIVRESERKDDMKLTDDASCAVIFRRVPRKMLLCTGPPYNNNLDKYLSEMVAGYRGVKILCGGTTAKIISRELKEEIIVASLDEIVSNLPPACSMKGVDLITEGILTLGKVSEMLEKMKNNEISYKGPAADIVRYFINADIIDVIVGTRINEAHQDPKLPVELEIRRNVIKKIIKLLEEKFLKQVRVQYI